MKNVFESIKDLVNIRDYIESETSTEAKKVGASWRIVPCPFCDSKTGFTINVKSGYFKCFSCRAAGDVIEFEQRRGRWGTPLEAAKKIAEQYKIPVKWDPYTSPPHRSDTDPDFPPLPEEPPNLEPQPLHPPEYSAETTDVGGMNPERAAGVRRVAAEYYHSRLMSTPEALGYQMSERKHNREILDRLKVGLGGGSLIAHCRAKDISPEELMAVGLVQETKRGLRSTISGGVTVYPHFKGSDVLFFSLKDPEKKKPWQLKKAFAPEDWLCYGQDVLEQSEPVIIVEGENDRITIMDLAGYDHVMATIASYNEPKIIEKLKTIAKGRTWYLAFDNDPPPENKPEGAGARYTREYGNALFAAGGEVRIIELLPEAEGMKVDIDDVLRKAADPAAKLKKLMDGAKKLEAPLKAAERRFGGDGTLEPPAGEDAYNFKSFEVLGELQDEKLLFWSKSSERLYSVALRDLQLDKLVQIGGIEVATRVARSSKTAAPGQILFSTLKKKLIVDAGKRQLWDPEYLGQGIHAIPGKGLLVVVGGSAWLWDGQRLTKWDHPVIDGRIIEWKRGFDWVNMPAVKSRLGRMDRKFARRIQEALLEFVFGWGFRGTMDGWLLSGWYLAQILQSMWTWRPHLWMTGSAGSGKTLMNELFGALSGKLALRCEGQTLSEAGLRQSIGHDAVLVFVDEIEKSQKRDEIIYFIRSAGRDGGYTRKGTTGQKAVKAKIFHMVFLSSIERGVYGAAENSRYLVIETRKSEKYKPILPNSAEAEKLRTDIIAYALWASGKAKKLVQEVGRIDGHDPRFVESLAVAFSMLAVAHEDSRRFLLNGINDYLEDWSRDAAGERLEDEQRLFKSIIGSTIHLAIGKEDVFGADVSNIYTDRTVAQLLSPDFYTKDVSETVQAFGIRACSDGLFVEPEMVGRKLLRNSEFRGFNVGGILFRIPGSEKKQRTLAGSRPRGILIPARYCREAGMDITAWGKK